MKDRYAQVYAQIERETERYLHENTLCDGDIDRYGFGKHILRLLMSGLAMHAMGGLMGGTAAKDSGGGMPVSGDFEKLHPRGQSQNAGQFAEKPGKGITPSAGVATPKKPKAGSPDDLYNQAMAAKAATDARSEKIKQNFGKPSIPTQQPMDPITAAVAEKWHGDKQEPAVESPRNYPDNLNKPPEQQTPYSPPERTIEPTDDDLTAMKEDPYNYDPEQASGPAQAPQAPEPKSYDVWHSPKSDPSQRNSGAASAGLGEAFATDNHEYAAQYGTPEKHTATMNNPYEMDSKEFRQIDRSPDASYQKAKARREELQAKGHDGIIVTHPDGAKEHILFNKQNLKKSENVAAPKTQPQPDDDARAQQQAEARAKRNAEHAAKVAAEQKAAEKRVEFDPSEWENEPEEEPAPIAKVKTKDYTKKDSTGKVVEQDLVARDEARAKRANAVRSARRKLNSTAEERGDQNIAEMSENHGLHHDSFSQHVKAMESHEGGLWDAKEKAKTQIRKAWGVTSRDLEKLADKDHTSLEAQDNLSGNVENIHEHLGNDPHYWGQNAWDMLREDTPERPGVHNKEWLEHHAKQFKEMSNNQPQYDNHQDYEEPPDGAPFSRKALTAEIDRYFNEARIQYRKQRQTTASAIWTDKDRWL